MRAHSSRVNLRSCGPGGPRGGGAAAAGAPPPPLRAARLPMDWGLKRRVRVACEQPFAAGERLHSAPATESRESLLVFAGGASRPLCAQRALGLALLSSTHPSQPLPQEAVDRAFDRGFLPRRRELWAAALRDLVYAVRAGRCGGFYCVPPPGSTDAGTVAVFGEAVAGRPGMWGVLTHSTRRMRGELDAGGVGYSMPHRGAAASAREIDEAQELLAEAEEGGVEVQIPARGGVADNSAESLLLFEGAERVHGLYDFLLNEVRAGTLHAKSDVPPLLAPVLFEGGTLVRHELVLRRPGGGGGAGASGGAGPGKYALELAGEQLPLPPWTVHRLLSTLKRTQSGSFSARLEGDPGTQGLNQCAARAGSAGGGGPHRDAAAKGHGDTARKRRRAEELERGAGCWDLDEADAWLEPAFALRGVDCLEGTFVVKTAG